MTIDIPSLLQHVEHEFECKHEHTRVVVFTDSLGREHVRKQCQRCGAHCGDEKKNGYNLASLPRWDECLRDAWYNRKRLRTDELRAEIASHDASVKVNAKQAYREYLQSPQWKRVKKAVLERDRYICQNCFRKVEPNIYPTPTRAEVHHKHYTGLDTVGETFAFECVTLCHDCHRRYHGKDAGDDE